MIVIGIVLKSLRLAIILQNIREYKSIIIVHYIGILINSFIPFRMGELFMIFELSKKLKKLKTSITSFLIMDRLFEFLMVGIIFTYCTLQYNLNIDNKNIVYYLVGFLMFSLTILLIVLKFRIAIKNKLSLHLKKNNKFKYPKLFSLMKNLFFEINSLIKPKTIISVFLLSIMSITLFILSLYFVAKAFINEPIFISIILSYCLLIIGIAITSSPGGIGIIHAAITYGLILFGVNENQALIVAISFHLLNLIHSVIFGIGSIVVSDIKISTKIFKR